MEEKRPQFGNRAGITIVELLVSIGIIGLLTAILLPAIQHSRSAARRIQCKNNLHQIALATHSFHDQHGYIDTNSTLQSILPQIDQQAIADAHDAYIAYLANGAVGSRPYQPPSPALYVCPDDPYVARDYFQMNYLINNGSTIFPTSGIYTVNAPITRINGNYHRQFREITDGLSTTALFAERIAFLPHQRPGTDEAVKAKFPMRVFWSKLRQFEPGEEEALAMHCLDPEVRLEAKLGGGYGNNSYTAGPTPYTHIVPPNNWTFSNFSYNQYAGEPIPPSSYHDGTVHIAMVDGSVRGVTSSVDLKIWWAMGTIGRGDVAE